MGNGQDLRAEDDGLLCPEVGSWTEDKYRLISLYDGIFASGMKNKWDERVYIDLYAGAGFSRVKGTHTILKGSPLLALSASPRFDKYIFCEEDPIKLDALRHRTERIAPEANVTYISGKCDDRTDEIIAAIPRHFPGHKVLSLCFVDPFDFGFKFETLKRISQRYTDFLLLLAFGMDANRNMEHYVYGDSTKLDEALGNEEWRQRWNVLHRRDVPQFLAAEFSLSMESLGYLPRSLAEMKSVRWLDERSTRLYHLALFSKHETAYKFWDEVLKYSTDQTSFWS